LLDKRIGQNITAPSSRQIVSHSPPKRARTNDSIQAAIKNRRRYQAKPFNIFGEFYSQSHRDALAKSFALPERGVTVHSGDMGYTMGPFAGEQDALEGV
jgi:hypothetical protein